MLSVVCCGINCCLLLVSSSRNVAQETLSQVEEIETAINSSEYTRRKVVSLQQQTDTMVSNINNITQSVRKTNSYTETRRTIFTPKTCRLTFLSLKVLSICHNWPVTRGSICKGNAERRKGREQAPFLLLLGYNR